MLKSISFEIIFSKINLFAEQFWNDKSPNVSRIDFYKFFNKSYVY